VTVFPAGSFPESLAVRGGNLYVSLGAAGKVVLVTPRGQQTTYAAGLPVGDGFLTGLAFDAAGDLYVATATFAADPAPGVFKIPRGGGSITRVLTLPADSFPNGLAVHGKYLYVSDSGLGAIWRVTPTDRNKTLSRPWYRNGLLAPTRMIGANGIAFDATGRHLHVAVADPGRIVRLTLARNGSVSATTVVAKRQALRTADGIAFDSTGRLYITVNHTNSLFRLDLANGSLTRLANRSDGLAYPTQPAFDTRAGSKTLFVTSGALDNGVPSIEAFHVGASGAPLP
jgi:sugar lactone lactonase YvrE